MRFDFQLLILVPHGQGSSPTRSFIRPFFTKVSTNLLLLMFSLSISFANRVKINPVVFNAADIFSRILVTTLERHLTTFKTTLVRGPERDSEHLLWPRVAANRHYQNPATATAVVRFYWTFAGFIELNFMKITRFLNSFKLLIRALPCQSCRQWQHWYLFSTELWVLFKPKACKVALVRGTLRDTFTSVIFTFPIVTVLSVKTHW